MSDFRWTTIRLVLQKTFDRPLSLVVGGTKPNRRPPIERTNSCQLIILLLGAHLSRGPGRVRRPAGQPEFTFFDAHSRFFAQPRACPQIAIPTKNVPTCRSVAGPASRGRDGRRRRSHLHPARSRRRASQCAGRRARLMYRSLFRRHHDGNLRAAKISSSSLSTMTGSSAASSPRARRQRAAMERPSTAATPIRWPRGPWASRALCA